MENLRIVSFKKFLDSIFVTEVDGDTYQFHALEGYPDDGAEYTKKSIVLMDGPKEQVLKMQLLSQANVTHLPKTSLDEIAYNAVLAHKIKWGLPTHLVRIARRTWLVAEPKDFSLLVSDKGVGLACYNQARTELYIVQRKF